MRAVLALLLAVGLSTSAMADSVRVGNRVIADDDPVGVERVDVADARRREGASRPIHHVSARRVAGISYVVYAAFADMSPDQNTP